MCFTSTNWMFRGLCRGVEQERGKGWPVEELKLFSTRGVMAKQCC